MGKMKDLYTEQQEDLYMKMIDAQRRDEINTAVISELEELAEKFSTRQLAAKALDDGKAIILWTEALEAVERAIQLRGADNS